MRYAIHNDRGAEIIRGTLEKCEEVRRHYLDVAMMKRYRLLSRIYDARAGAIAFRTAFDKANELKCQRNAAAFRQQLGPVAKEIAHYRAAKPVEVVMRAA